MKKWARWEDYVAGLCGLYAALSVFWTRQGGGSTALMVIFGVLLIVSSVMNLSLPGTPWLEYAQCVLGVLLFISPWMGAYATHTGAAWTSWITGIISAVVTAAAIRPALGEHHRMQPSH